MRLEPLKIKLDKDYVLDYQKELAISESTINDDLKNQPSYFAFYVFLFEMAEEELAAKKLALEMTEAQLLEKYKNELIKDGKRPTEKQTEAKIHLDDEYIKAVIAVNSAKRTTGILKGIKEAFNHRREMLIAFASNLRAQMDSEVWLKKRLIKEEAERE